MRLTVVGCSGSYPGPESAASCYLLEAPDAEGRTWRVLLDLGSGALGALQRLADPLTVDAVLLSHLHPDHFFDLSGYYVLRRYHPAGPQPRIPVWGPTGTGARAAAAYGLPDDPGMGEEFDFHAYGEEPFRVGPFTVTARRVDHPVEAYGVRVEAGGASLAYSGDTGPCEALTELARGVDLLLCEAAFRDDEVNPPHLHLTGGEAAATAEAAGVRRLVLTHVPPWHDSAVALFEAKRVWGGAVDLAAEGAVYEVLPG